MHSLPHNLYTAEQVRDLDRLAIEKYGIKGITLMERAGKAAIKLLRRKWPEAKRIAVFCGAGNNGGDGYVLATLAHQLGLEVDVSQLAPYERLQGDALVAYKVLLSKGIKPATGLLEHPCDYDVIVDAILGTGLEGEVGGNARMAINTINKCKVPVLSLDIPSGLNADTGETHGVAINADATISFIGLKQGMLTGNAANYCGQIYFDSLQVPESLYEEFPPACQRLDIGVLQQHLTKRKRDAHKGHFGHVLVIGGNHGMSGAVRMAAEAAARMGSGLVSVATRKEHAAFISAQRPELMCHGVDTVADLEDLLERATVIAIGPGLGKDAWAQQLFRRAINVRLPLVIDADALHLLADEPVLRDNWVLTPHPGEAANLLEEAVDEIQENRFSSVKRIQKKYGGVCVLKGAGSLVIDSNAKLGISSYGNPGMASGGMGDVLTGVIAGLIAQGLSQDIAAGLAVCLHSNAADHAARKGGERGLLAMDLMPYVRSLVNA